MFSILSYKSAKISGEILYCPDKSISHRAIIFSSLSKGISRIDKLLESQDVKNTIQVFEKLGVSIKKTQGRYVVESGGFYSFLNHEDTFDMGNSGTSCRLISGVLASIEGKKSVITGDASLSKRPMDRVVKPLKLMGADIHNTYLPLFIEGKQLRSINYSLTEPSAQVKSCILLSGLFTKGITVVKENSFTRDHTENIMKLLNLDIEIKTYKNEKIIKISGEKTIPPFDYFIPNDFSSASFFIALGLITKYSEIIIRSVNLNPSRIGLLKVLQAMKGNITILNKKVLHNEIVGDILVKSSSLQGVEVSPNIIPTMIDEIPILSILATLAKGVTKISNIKELKYKESDRIKSIYYNLKKLEVGVQYGEDFLTIVGKDKNLKGGIEIDTFLDHRIAMSFLILGSRCESPISVLNCESIETSFPNFVETAKRLGLNLEEYKTREIIS